MEVEKRTDRWLEAAFLVIVLTGVSGGCQVPQLLAAGPANTVVPLVIQYHVLEPVPTQVDVRLDQVCRGPRGGVLRLSLRNTGAEAALLLDWSKATLRLGNGQYRKCIDRDRFVQLCGEFGAAAYGFADEAGQLADEAGWPFITAGAIHRLKPGEELRFAVPFGAPEEETLLTLTIDHQALYAEGRTERLSHPLRMRVELPNAPQWRNPDWAKGWWPDWLHLGVVVTNGG